MNKYYKENHPLNFIKIQNIQYILKNFIKN